MEGTTMSSDEEQAVTQAVMGFYNALAEIFEGNTGAMEEIWSHANDVTYMGPGGGYQEGWGQVLQNFRAQADLKMGGKGGEVTPENIRILVGQDIAVVHNFKKGRANIKGSDDMVSLRATNLFRKENGTWKQIGHHADLPPSLVEAIDNEC